MVRFNTTAIAIVSINTVNNQDYQAQSIIAISNNEAFYSFRDRNSSTHHLVKANFSQTNGTDFLLDEEYHKTIDGNLTHESISRLSHDSTTLWHAVNLDDYVTYFQLNLTNLSLSGSVRSLDSPITNGGLSMEVSQEVV